MANDTATDTAKGPAAPYTSYLTVRNILRDMKQHGVPTRVDRSVFPNLAGGTVGQVLPAMKFLGLTDNDGHPTKRMVALVASADTEQWPKALEEVIRAAYAPLFSINLEAASPGQFLELFRKTYPGAEDVSRKSQTFFLNAAREARITISPYIMKGKKPRSAPAKKRVKSPQPRPEAVPVRPSLEHLSTPVQKPMEYMLLDLMGGNMNEEERTAVWTLINYLKRVEAR